MNIQARHDAVKARLESILEQARKRAQSERGELALSDFVTMRALARDAESCAAELIAGKLSLDEASIASAEELATACEESLAISPQSIQAELRNGKTVAIE